VKLPDWRRRGQLVHYHQLETGNADGSVEKAQRDRVRAEFGAAGGEILALPF